jgi:hypothetical protein
MTTKEAVIDPAVPAPIPKATTFWEQLPAPLGLLLLAPVLLVMGTLAVFEAATVGRLQDRE